MRTSLLTLLAAAALGLTTGPVVAAAGAGAAGAAAPTYYVNLGDSYAVGYQPGLGATPGYAGYVAAHTGLILANFGCGGATTTSILNTVGCPDVLPHTAGAMTYPTTTQIAAAQAFITAHEGHIGLITVSIGGNDVTGCAANPNPISCIGTVVHDIETNVSTLAADLRAAAGPSVPIVGTTYPDVILGGYVYPTDPPAASTVSLVKLSVVAFKSLINPSLAKAYASSSGSLVDVTKASGSYVPLTRTVHTATYGTIPVATASVCALTWFCAAHGNIHAKTSGYDLIGKLIVARYRAVEPARGSASG